MSGDEIFALIVCVVIGFIGWMGWMGGLFFHKPLVPKKGTQAVALIAPLFAAALMLFVLLKWSSHDVRSNIVYICFYLVMWFGWLGASQLLLPYFGLSVRDDLFERQNPAAAVAIAGALIGFTLAFAGGNIGDGPGWWVVVFSSGLATGTLVLLWVFGNMISRVAEAITIDRDVAAGWRAFGFFIGGGLIVGRAAAGNWQSAGATASDFVSKGWPVLIVWVMTVVLDVAFRPSPANPIRPTMVGGLFPALLLVALGLIAAIMQGAW
jgi:uncharacterized membrane protein YjfL (UPF0719 family)